MNPLSMIFRDPDVETIYESSFEALKNHLENRPRTINLEIAKFLKEQAEQQLEQQFETHKFLTQRCVDLLRSAIALAIGYLGLLRVLESLPAHSDPRLNLVGPITLCGATSLCLAALFLLPCMQAQPYKKVHSLLALGELASYFLRREEEGKADDNDATAGLIYTASVRLHRIIDANEVVHAAISNQLRYATIALFVGVVLFVVDLWF